MLIENCPPSASSGSLQAVDFIELRFRTPTPIIVETPRRNTLYLDLDDFKGIAKRLVREYDGEATIWRTLQ